MMSAVNEAERYTESDHLMWARLFDGYLERLPKYGCREVIAGFQKLGFRRRVESIAELSERVYDICGWRLQAVKGMVPVRGFFDLLSEKVYPMAVQIRQPHELEFAELPDRFHDAFGHLPLLVHPPYTRYLERYAETVSRYIDSEQVVGAFGRLYWYTTETGLVMEDGREKIFGAAILTSRAECENAMSEKTGKLPLDLGTIFDVEYDNLKLQPRYFIIESFESLLSIAEDLDAHARRLHETGACHC
jgi:phenylalanine-4-hydroxylase